MDLSALYDGDDETEKLPVKLQWLLDVVLTRRFIATIFCFSFLFYSWGAVHPESDGNTMHVAAGTGNMQTLRGAMAEGGGTISQTNAYGNTPLHVACECGQFEAAELLLTSKHIHPCLGAKNTVNQATPLTCAKIYRLRYGQLRADHFNEAYGSMVGWALASVCRTSHHEANALAIEALLKTWGVENKVKVAM